ncbi:hypothetical protein EJ06DRAFT_528541 [Trichodelitschia bisporula]|uniref:RNA polymerase II subunit A C-terminal domain phosphatase n=1 Tax=Trichodelitschia bisporula TaxID=703511 RepID=A0A6G1I2Y1_9PEZI|nr:hypothetical protein EJ06DRAFT_528541 [Trichodelitschia bisporula]
MLIRSTQALHYPITVTELLVQPGDAVDRFAPLFTYTYKSTVTEGNKYGDERVVEKTWPAEFQSEIDGKVLSWKIKAGDVIKADRILLVEIEEPCKHEVQFAGLCTSCYKDMTEVDYVTTRPNASRATINMSHSHTALKVSQEEAGRASEAARRRLLSTRKLSLVVDLDQTIIHATVDPTVAEWQKDPSNPNYEAVKDVKAFQLVDDGPGGRGCWYYIKMRPGLEQFLEQISQLYELHIYTMGTRAYAQNIAKIVDPQQKYFGDRILSRDESGSLTVKTLQRLFPVDTKMVVIIDDRGDVWQWSPNLIKVVPYDFFVGIGDINSSFLPKRSDILKAALPAISTTEILAVSAEASATGLEGGPVEPGVKVPGPADNASTLEQQIVAMAGGDNPNLLEEQSHKQEEAIAAQVTDRPLLKKQELLDKQDEEAGKENRDDDTSSEGSAHRSRHNLLQDNDTELSWLQMNLETVHQKFYADYEENISLSPGGRLAELRGDKWQDKPIVDDFILIPDVKDIMPPLKEQVLSGVVLCITGIIPQGINHQITDLGMWAKSFGASISPALTKRTTHVIGVPDRRTKKVRQASRYPGIKIVTLKWLLECFTRWTRVNEKPYLIEVEQYNGPNESLPFDEYEAGMILTPSEAGDNDGPDGLAEDDDVISPSNESPIEVDDGQWAEMDEELKEFLGDDEDDTDYDTDTKSVDFESDASTRSTADKDSRKRKRGTESADASDAEDTDSSVGHRGSQLQKRKKRALERTSSLANVTSVDNASGLPSPDATGPDEDAGEGQANGRTTHNSKTDDAVDGGDDDDEAMDDLEREMLAEFSKSDDSVAYTVAD